MSNNNTKIKSGTNLTQKASSILVKNQRLIQIIWQTNDATLKPENHRTDDHQRITYTLSESPNGRLPISQKFVTDHYEIAAVASGNNSYCHIDGRLFHFLRCGQDPETVISGT